MLIARLLLAALAYVSVTAVLFGNPLQPIAFATFWSDRLGVPHWRVIALLCVAASALIFARPLKNTVTALLRPLVFRDPCRSPANRGRRSPHGRDQASRGSRLRRGRGRRAILLYIHPRGPFGIPVFLTHGGAQGMHALRLELSEDGIHSWCRRTWGQTSYRSTGSRGVGSSGFDRQIEPPSASHPMRSFGRSGWCTKNMCFPTKGPANPAARRPPS